jgi:V8-like Glu-specific endopeptidase
MIESFYVQRRLFPGAVIDENAWSLAGVSKMSEERLELKVRYLGIVLVERSLDPGTYTMGRSADNDIQLTHDFISRRHGKVFFSDDQWWYQDQRSNKHPHYQPKPVALNDDKLLELENDIDILTEGYLRQQDTQIYDIKDLKTMARVSARNRRRIYKTLAFIGVLILTGAGSYLYYLSLQPMDANALLKFTRTKIVEFEKVQDTAAIEDYKKHAAITASELKEKSSFCSGFIVAPNLVLTASHCVNHSTYIDLNHHFQIRTADKKTHRPSRVLGLNVKRDYLFLEVPGLESYGSLELVDDTTVGKAVYTIGNVQGEGIAIRDGIMASTTKDPNDPTIEYLRYSAATSPGNSGGPLVDGYGRVVGLVFAATRSENYNVATAGEHLLDGMRRFLTKPAQHIDIVVKTEDILNFHPFSIMQILSIPLPDSWRDNPKYMEAFKKLETTIRLPATMDDYAHQVVGGFNKSVLKLYDQTLLAMAKESIREGSWAAHLGKAAPVIVPSSSHISDFKLVAEMLVPRERISFVQPAAYGTYKHFLEQLEENEENSRTYHYPSDAGPSAELYKDKSMAKRQMPPKNIIYVSKTWGDKSNLGNLAGRPHLYLDLALQGASAKVAPSSMGSVEHSELVKKLVGEKGMLFSTHGSSFIRPKAHRNFTIKSINKKAQLQDILDHDGRRWKRYSFKLFENQIDSYCLPLPQGSACLTSLQQETTAPLLSVLRENKVRFALSKQILEPLFWNVDALIDFQEKGAMKQWRTLKDFRFRKDKKGDFFIGLHSLGVEFRIPKKEAPGAIRLRSGLLRGKKDEPPKWVAFDFDVFFPQKENVCTAGVEVKDIRSSVLISSIRDELRRLNKEMGSEAKKPGKGKTSRRYKGLAKIKKNVEESIFRKARLSFTQERQGEIFGQCAGLIEDDKKEKIYRSHQSFYYPTKNKTPYKPSYKIGLVQ